MKNLGKQNFRGIAVITNKLIFILLLLFIFPLPGNTQNISHKSLNRQLSEAQDCYDKLDFECVTRTLKPLSQQLHNHTNPEERGTMIRIETLLGLAYLSRQQESEARLAFRRLLALDPDYQLIAEELPPSELLSFYLEKGLILAQQQAQRVQAQTEQFGDKQKLKLRKLSDQATIKAKKKATLIFNTSITFADTITTPTPATRITFFAALNLGGRLLTGVDRSAFAPALKLALTGGVGLTESADLGIFIGISSHKTLLEDTLFDEPPELVVLDLAAFFSIRKKIKKFELSAGVLAGAGFFGLRTPFQNLSFLAGIDLRILFEVNSLFSIGISFIPIVALGNNDSGSASSFSLSGSALIQLRY